LDHQLHKSVYIPSIEANDLYCHMFRNKELDFKYVGMIPSSLELNKLISIGMKTRKHNTSDKLLSDDIINVKFKQKVKSADEIIAQIKKKIKKIKDDKYFDYKQKLNDYVQLLKQEKATDKWHEVSNENLRQHLYVNGFTITTINKKTNKTKSTKYVVYKRSSAKSRVGECLFIKEKLFHDMMKWSQMDLALEKFNIDVPSLLAYQSLVGSSLDGTIKIKPENILIISDIDSKFKRICNVVRKGTNGLLDSFEEEVEISNSLFDGESLLESRYFPKGKGMLLLRNHMFKSAAFNCKIQDYFQERYKEINGSLEGYDKWKIPTMFEGEMMYAKDVQLIITPSSLKALKFSHVVGSEKDMYNYWKNYVKDEEGYSLFGVVKSEKKTKHGTDDNGKELQQTSYQMLNCLPMSKEDIDELSKFENQYIEKLKNDDDFFVQHIQKSVNSINSNAMFIDLYYRNRDIVKTKPFRDFRKSEINRHVTHVKSGKIRLNGDYCTMLGNPIEFLEHALGYFDIDTTSPALKGNEIYTTLFEYEKELVGFRNPNTSPSNVLVAKNVYNELIERYFNLSDNIVCVNAINFPLQDILSGSDYDSDTLLLFDNPKMLELAKKCFGKYKVCINKVASSKKQYQLTELDMSVIDNQLSMSQKNIGRVVNLGQFCMSRYWDLLNQGKTAEELSELLKKIDIMTVLSGICIDLAKKFYDIDIDKEVEHVSKAKELNCEKPLFWRYVSQKKDVLTKKMNCPMDYLYETMSDCKYADHQESLNFKDLLVKYNIKNGDRKQEKKIIDYVEQMCSKINHVYATVQDEEERTKLVEDINKYYEFYICKLMIRPETMYSILTKLLKNKSKIAVRLMNVLYRTQKETFINSFCS
jgi:hypothetical protein